MAKPDRPLDASALRDWAHSAVGDLITHIDEINRLNVFPVADSDTGINMLFTMRSALAEANAVASSQTRPGDVVRVAAALSGGALNGARGNSGVILSQLIRGAAEELVSRPGELIDPTLIGAALLNAANRAYSSVRNPAEGTILTVAREMAHQIVADVAHAAESTRIPRPLEGKEAVLAVVGNPEAFFTDIHNTVHHMIAEGDYVALRNAGAHHER